MDKANVRRAKIGWYRRLSSTGCTSLVLVQVVLVLRATLKSELHISWHLWHPPAGHIGYWNAIFDGTNQRTCWWGANSRERLESVLVTIRKMTTILTMEISQDVFLLISTLQKCEICDELLCIAWFWLLKIVAGLFITITLSQVQSTSDPLLSICLLPSIGL